MALETTRQVNLAPKDIPRQWYNLVGDLPAGMEMPPPKDPEEGPSRIERLPKFLVGECLKQEMSRERWIDIPEEVIYYINRSEGRVRCLGPNVWKKNCRPPQDFTGKGNSSAQQVVIR